MAGMGPAPKHPARRARRNASISMTRLPGEGRKGRTPAWPLLDDVVKTTQLKMLKAKVKALVFEADDPDLTPKKRAKLDQDLAKAQAAAAVLEAEIKAYRRLERSLWTQLWKTPQAVQWERLRWTREVAQYVRWKVRAELGDLKASTEARQLADRLGLNPLAMLRLRWEIATGESEDDTGSTRAPAPTGSRARYGILRAVASE